MSAIFETSLAATAYRALEIRLFPAPSAVLPWDQLGQRRGRRVHLADYDHAYLELAETPRVDSVTALAISTLAVGLRVGEGKTMDWFTGLGGDEPEHHFSVHEEVLSRATHGWITLIQGPK